MNFDDPVEVVRHLSKPMAVERGRLSRFTMRARGYGHHPWAPESADEEYQDLARAAVSNWLALVISANAQGLFIDGYRRSGDASDSTGWGRWQRNQLDARQSALFRAVLTHGYAYGVALPGDNGAEMLVKSAAQVFGFYDSELDDWPRAALQVDGKALIVYLPERAYRVAAGSAEVVAEYPLDHPPVVRFVAEHDLLGAPMGVVEQMWPIQRRITETVFGLLMAQRYASFKQRWVTGMAPPLNADGTPKPVPVNIAVDGLIMGESPDTKFGQFEATDLRQYVEALETHVRHLAACSQVPPHYLLGSMANLSADAIAAADSGHQRALTGFQMVLGEAAEQFLRLAAAIDGDEAGATDLEAKVHWRDSQFRSLSQVGDALNKLAGPEGVRVPREMLFEMIPGWDQTDVNRAKELSAAEDPMAQLLAGMARGQTSDPAMVAPTSEGGR